MNISDLQSFTNVRVELTFSDLKEFAKEVVAEYATFQNRNNHEPEPQKDCKITIEGAIKYLSDIHGLKLAKQSIYCLVNDRKIPFIKPEGSKRLIFSTIQLDEWIENGRQKISHIKE